MPEYVDNPWRCVICHKEYATEQLSAKCEKLHMELREFEELSRKIHEQIGELAGETVGRVKIAIEVDACGQQVEATWIKRGARWRANGDPRNYAST